jgi:hypothetical protein
MDNGGDRVNDSEGQASRLAWEPMSLTKVGTFGDVLRGPTGGSVDGGGTMMEKTA